MVGFTAGEGCFSIRITKSSTTKIGFQVQLRFQITQYSIDKVLMNSLVNFWGCGKLFFSFRGNKVDFQILKINDLIDKVIPFFQSMSLQGVKSKDFADFCKAVDITAARCANKSTCAVSKTTETIINFFNTLNLFFCIITTIFEV